MKVTEIKEISKTRCKIYIDQEFAFVLYKGELRQYGIKESHEITEDDYHSIMQEVLPKRARQRCMNLLISRDYTEVQLRKKLKDGGYTEAMIDQAIEYVASYGYVDDLRYAVKYIECRQEIESRRMIEQKLWQKGIRGDTQEKAWELWEENGGRQDEKSMIKRLLDKKRYHSETADEKEKGRLFSYLLRKGFHSDEIKRELS